MNFELYSQYYDLIYQDKDTSLEVEYLESTLSNAECSGRKLLEIGCGSGRHGELLQERGWQWRGIERSKEMANLARKKGLVVDVGEAEALELDIQRVDAVLALFHVVSYLTTNQQLRRFFRGVNKYLIKDGLFLFDIWYSPAVFFQRPEKRSKQVENGSLYVHREATPEVITEKNMVNVHYDLTITDKKNELSNRLQEMHPMRHFSLPELELWAEIAGFQQIMAEEWVTRKVPSEATWGVSILWRKQAQ